MPKKTKWNLYALLKDGKPIYVGVTIHTLRREAEHRKDKDFDILYTIKIYDDKNSALAAENALIRFNGLFNIGLINAQHESDKYVKLYLFSDEN